MKRVALMVTIAAMTAASAAAQETGQDAALVRAHAFNEKTLTVDTHVDIPIDYATAANDPGRMTALQVDLPKLRAGGLNAPFFIVYTPQGPLNEAGLAEARRIAETRLQAILRMTRAYPRDIALARNAAEARAIRKSGRVAAFIGMENPFPLGNTVAEIPRWAAAGVSYIGITHFGHNQFGDSANPSKDLQDTDEKWGGLSPLGRELVAAINKAGVMVDVSHAGRKTTLQAVELSVAPVIASHSCVQALADAPRNLTDAEIKAIAAKGGVVQITAVDFYVKPLTPAQTAAREKIRKEMKLETSEARDAMSPETAKAYKDRQDKEVYSLAARGSVKDFVDHVEYVAKLVGIDHVGISSDFDGGGGIVGWEDASETANVTAELFRRGYSEAEVAKIWSGNLLRVLGEAQKIGARLRKDAGGR